MPNPQNPELRRSEEGNIRPRVELGPDPTDVGGETGPVPPDNQPGHHPQQDQDKPPADKFAEALGIKSDAELTEEGGEDAPTAAARAGRRAAKKAASRKAAAKRAATTPAAAPAASPRRRADKVAGKPASETPIQPASSSSSTSTAAASAPRPAEAQAAAPGDEATSAAITFGAGPHPADEPAEQAAAQHHHALPDDELPHDTGMVMPSGTPVTGRVLLWPLRSCGSVLKASGGAISAYGNALRKLGERLAPGGR